MMKPCAYVCTACQHPLSRHLLDIQSPGSALADGPYSCRHEGCDCKIGHPRPSITCPQCGRTSYNPNDIRERYCGHCHAYHDTMRRDD